MIKFFCSINLRSLILKSLSILVFFFATTSSFAGKTAAETKKTAKPKQISIAVLGDSLADGLYAGLVQLSRRDKDISLKVKKYSKVNTGLVRYDRYNWTSAVKTIGKKDKSDIFIFMFGANDLQSIRTKSKRYHFQTDGWVERYTDRIDGIMKSAKKSNRKLFWVGLPIVGKADFAKGYKYLNGIYKKRAAANGVKYIESWDWFASKNGKFQMSGVGADGKKRLLRAKDKVHFTPEGYVDLSHFVAREIKIAK